MGQGYKLKLKWKHTPSEVQCITNLFSHSCQQTFLSFVIYNLIPTHTRPLNHNKERVNTIHMKSCNVLKLEGRKLITGVWLPLPSCLLDISSQLSIGLFVDCWPSRLVGNVPGSGILITGVYLPCLVLVFVKPAAWQ